MPQMALILWAPLFVFLPCRHLFFSYLTTLWNHLSKTDLLSWTHPPLLNPENYN